GLDEQPERAAAILEHRVLLGDDLRERLGIADLATIDRDDDRVLGETELLDDAWLELGDHGALRELAVLPRELREERHRGRTESVRRCRVRRDQLVGVGRAKLDLDERDHAATIMAAIRFPISTRRRRRDRAQ